MYTAHPIATGPAVYGFSTEPKRTLSISGSLRLGIVALQFILRSAPDGVEVDRVGERTSYTMIRVSMDQEYSSDADVEDIFGWEMDDLVTEAVLPMQFCVGKKA